MEFSRRDCGDLNSKDVFKSDSSQQGSLKVRTKLSNDARLSWLRIQVIKYLYRRISST